MVEVKGNPIDRLIKEVLLEERVGETFATLDSCCRPFFAWKSREVQPEMETAE